MIHPDATIAVLREELARTEERARLHASESNRLGEQLAQANHRAVCAEMERDSAQTITRATFESLANTLRAICRADRTTYNHHEARAWDGQPPRENGGTIWLTPREQAAHALRRLAANGHITNLKADWREGGDR